MIPAGKFQALLPGAHRAISLGNHREALCIYETFARERPELFNIIAGNIHLISLKLFSLHEQNCSSRLGSEYINWIVNAMRSTHNFNLFRALPDSLQKPTDVVLATRISIIMPTWNRAFIIGKAIRSVLSQTHQNWELLICDDGSTDNTQEVVCSFGDPRIKYYKLCKANGAIARNHGLHNASGDLITFLDSDNIWSPIHLSLMAAHMATNSSIDMAYSAFVDIELDNGAVVSAKIHYHDYDFAKLAYRNYIDLNVLCIRSWMPRLFGYFDPALPRQQDWDLITRYSVRAKIAALDVPTACYFRNKEWAQVTITQKDVDTRSQIMKKNKSIISRFEPNTLRRWPPKSETDNPKIAIKISAPNQAEAVNWGDFFFAHAIGKALQSFGWSYQVDCQDRWYSNNTDVALVLRGRHGFYPCRAQNIVNIEWIISHPDRLKFAEFSDYDHILVASSYFTAKVRNASGGVPATTLLQATEIQGIVNGQQNYFDRDLIFIASSRGEDRKMTEWCYDENIDLHLYGSGWSADSKARSLLRGGYIANEEIKNFYSRSRIVLNDHWPDMSANGFISNRIFDACAAGALVISDDVLELDKVFGDSVLIAKSSGMLARLVKYYLSHEDERVAKASSAQQIALRSHSFYTRASYLDRLLRQYIHKYYAFKEL